MRPQVKDDQLHVERSSADQTQQSLRSLGGLICPRCRKTVTPPAPPTEVLRCEADGFALVKPSELSEADGDPFLGATIADRFVIVGRLGAGSMGTVYRARQAAMGRDVAVKILRSDRAFDAQAKARFTREAKAMSLLTSPHTVTVFDFGEIPEDKTDDWHAVSLYLAMEMLEGESLGMRLKRHRRLEIGDAVRITRHALLSLAEAHGKGIIHRDLKPDNLFLVKAPSEEEGESCKVLDFGIAKVMNESAAAVDALETQAGTVFGTPRYMSPEQAQGKPLDARSDLYALGVLLYQMLVGRPPFVDDDAVVVMARHIKSFAIPPSQAAPEANIPQALSDIVMRALAKDPKDRPQTANEFITEVERAVGLRAPSSAPPRPDLNASATGELAAVVGDDLIASSHPSARPRSSGRPLFVVAAASALALGAALSIGLMRGHPAAVIEARSGLDHAALARAQVAMHAIPPESTPESAPSVIMSANPTSSVIAPPAPPPSPASSTRRPKKYTRFE
jgi:serine/threonine-protein kinase